MSTVNLDDFPIPHF